MAVFPNSKNVLSLDISSLILGKILSWFGHSCFLIFYIDFYTKTHTKVLRAQYVLQTRSEVKNYFKRICKIITIKIGK